MRLEQGDGAAADQGRKRTLVVNVRYGWKADSLLSDENAEKRTFSDPRRRFYIAGVS